MVVPICYIVVVDMIAALVVEEAEAEYRIVVAVVERMRVVVVGESQEESAVDKLAALSLAMDNSIQLEAGAVPLEAEAVALSGLVAVLVGWKASGVLVAVAAEEERDC